METTIRDIINTALKECFGLEAVSFVVEQPKDIAHGDYATNVALVVSKQLGKNPIEVAEAIATCIDSNKPTDIAAVTMAAPGFINFSLSKDYFTAQLQAIASHSDRWGSTDLYKGKKILVEHSSPNLFKAFHIGHVMNNAIGESIKRLAEFSGADVTAISYPSDVSLGIAKAVYVLMQDGGIEKNLQIGKSASNDMRYLGECYIRGTKLYEDSPELQSEIRKIADNIFKIKKKLQNINNTKNQKNLILPISKQ